MTGTARPTAGIVVIGNEILSGKVVDANSPFLARELRLLGVDLRRVEVIPDEVEEIAGAVARHSADYTWVFTSGGLGPTHDDLTIAGIAAGFGRPVVRNPFLTKVLADYYGSELNDARLRMADVPDGAEIVSGPRIPIPVVVMRNVIVLPGIPDLFRRMFDSIRARFAGPPFHTRRVYVRLAEADIVEALEQVTEIRRDVQIGSYPHLDKDLPYRVLLTLDSGDGAAAEAACAELVARLPEGSVLRVE